MDILRCRNKHRGNGVSARASRSHEEASIEMFRKDPDFATAYLNHVLLEGSQEDLLLALRYMSEAFGGIASLANRAGLNPKTLYRTLSARGNPELRSLSALLRAMGMTLAVQPLERPASRPRTGVRRV